MTVRIVRSARRFTTQRDWSLTRHSFSFGGHHDPSNTHFGALVAHNEELLQPGPGYVAHEHRGVDILTWVIEGTLQHEDSTGNTAETAVAQLLSAGGGVVHSERSADHRPVRFVQMWLQTEESGQPYHQRADVVPTVDALTPVASAEPGSPLRLRSSHSRLQVGTGSFAVPAAPMVHLFVVRGPLALGDDVLQTGDAARMTDAGPCTARSAGGQALILSMQSPG